MSALYVTCPTCGPLLSFIPQGQQFNMEVKCLCGARICHTENCYNYQTRKELQRKLNKLQGKETVCSLNKKFTETEQEMNNC